METKQFTCCRCGQTKPLPEAGGTGYGYMPRFNAREIKVEPNGAGGLTASLMVEGVMEHHVYQGYGVPYIKKHFTKLLEERFPAPKTCYACIGKNDQLELEQATRGQRFTFYLITETGGQGTVNNWPGTWSIKTRYWTGRHNIARVQYFTRFTVGGNEFYGRTVGDNTQIHHVKCITQS